MIYSGLQTTAGIASLLTEEQCFASYSRAVAKIVHRPLFVSSIIIATKNLCKWPIEFAGFRKTFCAITMCIIILLAAELSERLKGGVSIFRRRKKAEFEHFTSEQRRMLDAAIFSVERLLLAKTGQSFGVEEYLREDN